MKVKHSKFKNTGILFELLVRQITADSMVDQNSKALGLIKKFFMSSELAKENKLYQSLVNSEQLNEQKANVVISTILDQSSKINRVKLNKEKFNLIKEIKSTYDMNDFFKAKINNYKTLASIYVLFESYTDKKFKNPETIISSKISILEHLTKSKVSTNLSPLVEEFLQQDRPTQMLVQKVMLENFNKKFSNFTDEQKEVLREYIQSVSDSTNLKKFLDKKFKEVRLELLEQLKTITEPVTKIKVQEVITLIKPILESKKIKDEQVSALLQYQELVNELKKVNQRG
jgi:hypothetical protein